MQLAKLSWPRSYPRPNLRTFHLRPLSVRNTLLSCLLVMIFFVFFFLGFLRDLGSDILVYFPSYASLLT